MLSKMLCSSTNSGPVVFVMVMNAILMIIWIKKSEICCSDGNLRSIRTAYRIIAKEKRVLSFI